MIFEDDIKVSLPKSSMPRKQLTFFSLLADQSSVEHVAHRATTRACPWRCRCGLSWLEIAHGVHSSGCGGRAGGVCWGRVVCPRLYCHAPISKSHCQSSDANTSHCGRGILLFICFPPFLQGIMPQSSYAGSGAGVLQWLASLLHTRCPS